MKGRTQHYDMCSCAGRSSTNEYNFKDCVNFRKIAYDDYNAYKEASKNLTEHCQTFVSSKLDLQKFG